MVEFCTDIMKRTYWLLISIIIFGSALVLGLLLLTEPAPAARVADFDGQRAFADLTYQVELGPRTPGSQAHQAVVDYFTAELTKAGWNVEIQETTWEGHPIRNVIAKRGSGPWVIIGAHYDTRMAANRDPDPIKQAEPVPGANDGASGAAVLLELARSLPADLNQEVWLVFFDAEDQGGLPGWDWIQGSRAMAAGLDSNPQAVIVVDMVADADLNIYMERNSDPELTGQIWDIAAELGYGDTFIPEAKHGVLDDHTPFLEKGIPAVVIIDIEYPYWHTTQDTLDKVSANSLEVVGRTLQRWLMIRDASAR